MRNTPQGQGGKHRGRAGLSEEEFRRESALEALGFLVFQVALARRRVEGIMDENDLAMVTSWRELTFIHTVLTDVDSLLRRLRRATTDGDEEGPSS